MRLDKSLQKNSIRPNYFYTAMRGWLDCVSRFYGQFKRKVHQKSLRNSETDHFHFFFLFFLAFFTLDFLESAFFVAELPDELDFLAIVDFLLVDDEGLFF